jgi:hypothetical protein
MVGIFTLLTLFIISIGVSLFFFRRAQLAPYYVIRENARRKGRFWLVVSTVTLVLLVSLVLLDRFFSAPAPPPTPPPASATPLEPLASPTSVTPTSTPTFTPSVTPTRRPTATPPPLPTPTPAYPLPDTALTPPAGATPAGAEATITLLTLALDEQNGRPEQPGSSFPPGEHRVYLFFEYQGMEQGNAWTYAWYREGEFLDGDTRLWSLDDAGASYLYYSPPGGYEPGVYEVRVWIEDELQGIAQFEIVEGE